MEGSDFSHKNRVVGKIGRFIFKKRRGKEGVSLFSY